MQPLGDRDGHVAAGADGRSRDAARAIAAETAVGDEGMVVAVGRAGGAIDELVAARHRGAGQKMHAVAIDVRDGLGAGRLDVEQVERLEAVRAAPVTALVPDAAPREIPSVPIYEADRSEEHTSELQSLMRNSYAVFC